MPRGEDHKYPGIKVPFFPLPGEDYTDETSSYCVTIPAGIEAYEMLIGLLAKTTYWFNWQRDAMKRGKTCADAWRDALNLPDLGQGCDDMGCCIEPIYRWSEDGTLQVSKDGGLTWHDVGPGEDPRDMQPQFPPLPGEAGSAKACEGATNFLEQLKRMQQQTFNGWGTAITWQELGMLLVSVILVFFAPAAVAALLPIIFSIVSTIWTLGKDAWNAKFSDTAWAAVLCHIVSNIGTNGDFNQSGWQNCLDGISADASIDQDVRNFVVTTLRARGVGGINALCRIPSGVDPDCAECEWCYEWDFSAVSGSPDWSSFVTGETADSHWVSGSGWVGGLNSSNPCENGIKITIPDGTVVNEVTLTVSPIQTGTNPMYWLFGDDYSNWNAPAGLNHYTWTPNGDIHNIINLITTSNFGGCSPSDPTNATGIVRVKIKGTGANPYWSGDVC